MKQPNATLLMLLFCASWMWLSGQTPKCSAPELSYLEVSKDTSYLSRKSKYESLVQNFIDSVRTTRSSISRQFEESYISIPVIVHLIGNDVISQVSLAKVNEQLQILNSDFRKKIGTLGDGDGLDTEIEFCLASKDPYGNPTNGVIHVVGNFQIYSDNPTDNSNLKSMSHWPIDSYLNIWVCNVSQGFLGWSKPPTYYVGTSNEYLDGVVVGVKYFGITADVDHGHGRTLTHEVGHWLNLDHTFGMMGCLDGDNIDDTPYCHDELFTDYSSGCPKPQECTSYNLNESLTDYRQVENYMDYADDQCKAMFTYGQKLRMIASLNIFRYSLFSSQGCLGNNGNNESGSNTDGGSGFGNSLFDGACQSVQFTINGKPTNAGQVINVCKTDIVIMPFNYDDSSCGAAANWLFRINSSNRLCSNTSNMWQAGSKEYNGILKNRCQCYWLRLFIGIQECDENLNLIGVGAGTWLYFFDNDQSMLAELTSLRQFYLHNYLPPGFQLQEGKHYAIKVASYDQGTDGTSPWVEHTGYFRTYKDDITLETMVIDKNQFANNILISNSIVPWTTGIKVVAKNRIEINPTTTLLSGTYYIANIDCNNLNQF